MKQQNTGKVDYQYHEHKEKFSVFTHFCKYNFFSFSAQDAHPTLCYDRRKFNEKASWKPLIDEISWKWSWPGKWFLYGIVKDFNSWRHPCKIASKYICYLGFIPLKFILANSCMAGNTRKGPLFHLLLLSEINVLCTMQYDQELGGGAWKKNLVIYTHINSSLTMQNTDWVVQHSAIFHIVINTIDTPKGSREGCRDDNYYLKTTIIIIIDWSISHSWCYNTKNLTCFFMEGKMLFKMETQGPTWSTGCPIPIKNSPWKVESAVELKGLSDPTLSWFLLHGVTRSIITTSRWDAASLQGNYPFLNSSSGSPVSFLLSMYAPGWSEAHTIQGDLQTLVQWWFYI